MSRNLDQTLLSLMPSHGEALPPQLIELAGALLAQSRQRASALKTEEEVARVHACCHLACERLKITLDLPPIVSRPPIPPRIYKRLFDHLDNTLPKASSSTRTPSKNTSARQTPTSHRTLPSRVTPTTQKSLAQFRAEANHTPTKSTGKAVPKVAAALPPWIYPTLRFMCRETNQWRLAPSMLAGAEYIIAPGGRRTKDEWVMGNLSALCGAIYYFVVQQVIKLQKGQEINRENYIPARREIRRLLGRVAEEVSPAQGASPAEFWAGHQVVKAKDIDAAVEEMTDRGWLEQDWFRGLTDLVAQGSYQTDAGGLEEDEGEDAAPQAKSTIRGADSMLQDKYDYTSDEKRREYRIWKEGVLGRIAQSEKAMARDRMEVDTR
ncbi:origin recognition complex, subunit 6 [Plectosphaerella plurivora]|uniref:Origin recognition complex, subunit 6 n=1 Tax=Plectosphaerella plurivora TaxID=936078 RepID=A0A9P9A902_9PEZI|nr:origin recognition complex, subunit 6 [Plectosphaerella plurivora]